MEKKTITKTHFIKRFTALCLSRLDELPQNSEARQILLKSLSIGFSPDKTYTEKQVNSVIIDWLDNLARISGADHVALRRALIDYGYLSRNPDGTSYRREKTPEFVSFIFDAEIDQIPLKAELEKAAAAAEGKKQFYLNQQSK